ncbi:hypothetical protein [Cerasicoccus arenae]|nr:hypothetical protein [Cerasicoccus arenae]MBK1859283.1 hypothetical protein [Cerasicoccus arenae]
MSKFKISSLLAVSAAFIITSFLEAKVVFTDDSVYAQTFEEGSYGMNDSTEISSYGEYPWIDNSSIVGWYIVVDDKEQALYRATNGHRQEGDTGIYLFRRAGDNGALGTIRSPSNSGLTAFGVEIHNDTNRTITGFSVSYLGQQWQQNEGAEDELTFQYSTNAISIKTGNWSTVEDLSFVSVADTGTSNFEGLVITSDSLSKKISGKISGIRLRDGESIWFRWVDLDNKGVDQALSIDSLKIEPKF